jgi:hypothetical protein
MKYAISLLALALGACQQQAASTANEAKADNAVAATPETTNATANPTANAVEPAIPTPAPTVPADDKNWPPAPGTPGGLPDDRRPVAEGNRDMLGPQGAASALETYAVNVEGKHWQRAHQQWGSDKQAVEFEKRWRNASEVHGMIGTPGETDGGAGSIYSEVPVQFYGTRLDGTRFNSIGKAVMRRVNGVDGATPRQLSWHIDSITLKDTR